jgi:hypothetical protein
MPRKLFPNFIIVSGAGQKVGKTHLATALIRLFSNVVPLVALKISPHVHDSLGNTILRFSSWGIRIFQDLAPHHKNSGKFLEAGAQESFFMETDDEHLEEAFDIFMKECNSTNHPVICESGALGGLIKPGILIFITHSTENLPEPKRKTLHQADLVLPAKIFSSKEITNRISFSGNNWCLTPG